MIRILEGNDKPLWVHYPKVYLDLVRSGKDEFLPWYLMDKENILMRLKGLKQRYPTRELFPFAREDGGDDVACWEKSEPDKVVVIHDFTSPGYEDKTTFASFSGWYDAVRS